MWRLLCSHASHQTNPDKLQKALFIEWSKVCAPLYRCTKGPPDMKTRCVKALNTGASSTELSLWPNPTEHLWDELEHRLYPRPPHSYIISVWPCCGKFVYWRIPWGFDAKSRLYWKWSKLNWSMGQLLNSADLIIQFWRWLTSICKKTFTYLQLSSTLNFWFMVSFL